MADERQVRMQDWFDLILGDENRVPNSLQVTAHDFRGVSADVLKDGSFVENWSPDASLGVAEAEHDGEPDDFLADHLGLPVISPRLQKALVDAGIGVGDVQFLPVHVFKFDGTEIPGFAIGNVLSRVRALDYERCILLGLEEAIDPATGQPEVSSIGSIAVNGAPLHGHDIVRLTEFFPPILVSKRYVDVVRKGKGKFTGATFSKVRVSE